MNTAIRAFLFLALFGGSLSAEDLVDVGGKVITSEDVERAFKRTSVSRKTLTPAQQSSYRKHVLGLLIDDQLMRQYLSTRNVFVDERKIDQHIAGLKKQLASKSKTLDQFLVEMEVDETTMRDDLRQLYRWVSYVDGQATPGVLKKYFEANREAFDGTEIRASHILAKSEPDQPAGERKQAKMKLETIRAQLAGGTQFSELARVHSDCPSKDQGGDLGFFPRKGVMAEPFAAAAFALPIGQVSEIVETEFGYHIIVVTERKAGKAVPFEEVEEEVKGAYAADLRQSILARMHKQTPIKPLK